MRASFKHQAAAIGLLALTACSGPSATAPDLDAKRKELGAYAATWVGLVAGETPEGASLPVSLSETQAGRKILGESYVASVAFAQRLELSESYATAASGATTILEGALGIDGKSPPSTGLPTAPSVGSGASLPTGPAISGGTLPTTPSSSSGTLPTAPSVGSGATVSLSPAIFAAAGGTASSSDLAASLCTFLEGLFNFLGTCSGATAATTSLEAIGGCSAITTGLSAKLAAVSIPGNTVTALACVGNKLKTMSCTAVANSDTAISSGFSSCGMTISDND